MHRESHSELQEMEKDTLHKVKDEFGKLKEQLKRLLDKTMHEIEGAKVRMN
jgi:hypothetical protein